MSYLVIKLGGELAARPQQLELIAKGIKEHQQAGAKIILVHGGGPQINKWSERLAIPVNKRHGRRVTDKATMEVMQAVVAGVVNPELVAKFREYGVHAAGLTGVDAGITTAVKRAPLSYGDETIDYGLIGEISNIDTSYISLLTDNNIVPVISCLTWSKDDGILNINADTLAQYIAVEMIFSELILLAGVPGVYDADEKMISRLSYDEWVEGLSSGWITSGMQPKLENGFRALEKGIKKVIITNPEGWISGNTTTLTYK